MHAHIDKKKKKIDLTVFTDLIITLMNISKTTYHTTVNHVSSGYMSVCDSETSSYFTTCLGKVQAHNTAVN